MAGVEDLEHHSVNRNILDDSTRTPQLQSGELDALVVGAGFAGCYQLKVLRDAGFSVKLVEAGSNYGGVWYWNRYPGARVDSNANYYQFSDPQLWKDWDWKQRFPGGEELRAYFERVADVWDLRKDTEFGCLVNEAKWDDEEQIWTVKTEEDSGERVWKVKWLLLHTGFAARRHFPDWEGIQSFKGTFIHPSYWPDSGLPLAGKRIAIIGTGATAVQLIQSLTPLASQLTVFQRTPNTALPMKQIHYTPPSINAHPKRLYPNLFAARTSSYGGFDYNFKERNTFDDCEDERLGVYEKLWEEGSFLFQLGNYQDLMFDEKANTCAYEFWRDRTRARIYDSRVADLLAPMQKPYPFGCKRIPLELGYFECFNKPHVGLIDVNRTPVVEVTEQGIKTSEKEMEFDYIVSATGYDSCTGGLTQIDIRGINNRSLKEYWSKGCNTFLGMSVAGFPNLFFSYGPQAPTALCNGPSCAELQGNWILETIKHAKIKGITKMVAKEKSAEDWRDLVDKAANSSLLPMAKSWYMGDNIPGKPRQPLFYVGGVPDYYRRLNEEAKNGYEGFELSGGIRVIGSNEAENVRSVL